MRTSAHRGFRPALEALEAREVPARFDWLGTVSTDALNPANWLSSEGPYALPGEDDHLHFGGVMTVLGEEGDPPSPGGGASVNCDNLQSLGSGFAGVHIGATYTGTVTMGEALTFGAFDLANGAISQSASAYDLTVTGTFNWTGGILNSSTTEATFTLRGATATISPGANNTIATGSTLNLVANSGIGASATFNAGTVQFAGGLGLVLDALCRVDLETVPEAAGVFVGTSLDPTKTKVLLKAGSILGVVPVNETTGGVWDVLGMKIENNGGEVSIKSGCTVFAGPMVAQAQPTVNIKQTSGKLIIEAGASLSARPVFNGYTEVAGGTIELNTPVGVTLPAQLVGNLTFAGGAIHFKGEYTEFKVVGDVTWTGGQFGPRLDVSDESKLDVWNIVGKLIFPANSTGNVAAATASYDPEQGVNANKRWEVLKFDSVQLPPDNSKPAVVTVPGNAPLEWYIITLPDGKKQWKLGAQN